jgi:hypothetical protein
MGNEATDGEGNVLEEVISFPLPYALLTGFDGMAMVYVLMMDGSMILMM